MHSGNVSLSSPPPWHRKAGSEYSLTSEPLETGFRVVSAQCKECLLCPHLAFICHAHKEPAERLSEVPGPDHNGQKIQAPPIRWSAVWPPDLDPHLDGSYTSPP
jgi:hypothetical protein